MLPLIPIALPPPSKGGGAEIECEIQVKYRPVSVPGVNAVHVYLWMNDGVNQWVAEGKPQNASPILFIESPVTGEPVPNPYPWGKLVGQKVSNAPGLPGNNPAGDAKAGPTLRSADICLSVDRILQAVDSYNDRQVYYRPLGPNSNTFAHWLLKMGGVNHRFRRPPDAVGWNAPFNL